MAHTVAAEWQEPGRRKAHCPKVVRDIPRPAPRLTEGEKFVKALKLRAELVAKLRR